MIRKEEINDFIANYLGQYNVDSYEAYAEKEDIAHACQNAIEWAERTMLDKVCEWLMLNADYYIFEGVEKYSSAMRHDFIENFRKAMEE